MQIKINTPTKLFNIIIITINMIFINFFAVWLFSINFTLVRFVKCDSVAIILNEYLWLSLPRSGCKYQISNTNAATIQDLTNVENSNSLPAQNRMVNHLFKIYDAEDQKKNTYILQAKESKSNSNSGMAPQLVKELFKNGICKPKLNLFGIKLLHTLTWRSPLNWLLR